MKKLEEKKSEEALLLVQKRHDFWRDLQNILSFESCRSSTVDDVEEGKEAGCARGDG